ncbi:ATP-binding cassette domain-containing protein [Clostridium beijerinckii]|nr:ATP-binding cassette domain-containing protein [Clostridium beijerinckii]MBF7810548.1 ATP-binding cassette domain-containing protein [Clostridium beijerinckii]NOW91257.1 ABC-2 type transport system ATP-binding protein/bacitracin transport system ATP-binding protein [Clostridium beijerinckii]NRT23820.1 ABC-2 type transport system ATP-binding protein/bacitracin transport system ATP-binding protein [Clostridium beijerinckii]NRT68598.1 ABC-2 type transport system ATP-binding protein/bacitracin t
MNYILKTDNLTKQYGTQLSVSNLCINIEERDIYGFIGRNGAGKTTTLKMILGLIPATSGKITVLGKEVNKKDISYLRNIGSIIEFPSCYENLTAYENLKLHSNYMGLEDKSIIDECLDKVDLLNDKKKKVKEYSLGMKQRLGIARAILHKPKLLILDEPTNGLDPLGIRDLRNFILRLANEENMTFIISSHILSELELTVTKLGIIEKGILLKEASMSEINNSYEEYVDVKVDDVKKAQKVLNENLNLDSSLIDDNYLRLNIKGKEMKTNYISKALVNNSVELFELIKHKEGLEDYFVRISGGIRL